MVQSASNTTKKNYDNKEKQLNKQAIKINSKRNFC